MLNFHIIIPARYNSTRLPGKALLDLGGQTVIERVYHQAMQAGALSVTIATDHAAIYDVATGFGANVIMTDVEHASGTDRVAQAVKLLELESSEIVVNVQGDEPFISPLLIQQAAHTLAFSNAKMSTLCWPINTLEMLLNPNIVKVVRDQNNHALYFSRSQIPFNRDNTTSLHNIYRHIGIYAYRVSFLLDLVTWPVCELESIEALEQLRVLWHGEKIHVEQACVEPLQDINTDKDLVDARNYLEFNMQIKIV